MTSYRNWKTDWSHRDEQCDCCGQTISSPDDFSRVTVEGPGFYSTYLICAQCPGEPDEWLDREQFGSADDEDEAS